MICNSTIWFLTGFVILFSLSSLQKSFLYCYSFETLCNERRIATNEVQWPPHCSAHNWLLGHTLWLPFGCLPVVIGFIQGISCTFVMLCNKRSTATNETYWPPHFQCVIDYLIWGCQDAGMSGVIVSCNAVATCCFSNHNCFIEKLNQQVESKIS